MSDSVPIKSGQNENASETVHAITTQPALGKDSSGVRDAWNARWPRLNFSHPELWFRFGILICAVIFLIEASGNPFQESILVIGAAFVLASLFSLTMTFQWRVLGDWRLPANQALVALFLLVLVIPFTAIMTPSLDTFPIPADARIFLESAAADLMRIPGITALFSIARGIMIFLFFLISMIVLVFNLDSTRRTGITVLGILYSLLLLILYPSVETVVGLLFLIFFLRIQWEKPLMIPPKLLPHLRVIQLDYLRELVEEGSLSTGETKVYLDQNPALFAQLLEFQLVEVDSIARDIIPGRRLLYDSSSEVMEKFASIARRTLWIMAGLLYFLLPDLIPFYFDDAIIMLIASGAGFGWIKTLFGERRQTRQRGRRT